MIKIRLRKNLLYLFVYYISAFIDYNILGALIYSLFSFNPLYICIFLFPLENIIGGLIIYLYQKNSIRKKKEIKYFGIKLIFKKKKKTRDGMFKKIILILFAAYFNYYNFIVSTFYYNDYIPWSMGMRLTTIQIIISTLICIYAFEFKIKKHQKISLIIIGICMFLLISNDITYIIYYKYKLIKVPIFQYFITLFYYTGYSFNNCIEKYLVDTNYMNPFIILMIEGIFELIIASLSIIYINPFEAFQKIKGNLALFIFLFILYTIIQVIVNVYRIYCNVIYSPMARSLIDYLLNPFINIFFFCIGLDFFSDILYFIFIEIMCVVMSFFGCVFNEYIILYFCGLELETKDEIAKRAESQLQIGSKELDDVSSDYENDEDDNNKNYSNKIFDNNGFGI